MEKINIEKIKINKIKEIELNQDLIVPDSKQDIFSILDGNFYTYFNKVEILDGKIKVNGNIDAYISYISSSEETVGLQTTFSFDDFIENNEIKKNMYLQYSFEILKQDIKIINERKISISIIINIKYEVMDKVEVEIGNDFKDEEDIEVKAEEIEINSFVGINNSQASLKEEIKLDGTDIVSDILRFETKILNKEVKISYNKVLTKADLLINIIYLTKDGRIGNVNETFPLMSFIEIENVKEDNICTTDYNLRNSLINYNNENGIVVQMEYDVICKAFEKKNFEIVTDLYSLKYDTELINEEIELRDISTNNEKVVDINEKIEINNIAKIIDIFGKCRMLKNNEWELDLLIYYETNNKIGLNVENIKIPFIIEKTYDNIECYIDNMEFDLNGNMILIKCEIFRKEINIKNNSIKVVKQYVKKEEIQNNDYGITVYNVKKNDNLWEVCKKFRIKQDNLINSNELKEPYSLNYGEKIYIVR